ncbi:MAG: uL30 family ribosomal protein [Nanoarchaeota archaeon]
MILVIRISGMVNVSQRIEDALYRLNLRRKYSAVLIHETPENLKLLKILRNHVAYGPIDQNTLVELIEARAEPIKKETTIKAKETADQLSKKSLSDLGIKPFFRLHPPRGGIDSKKHFGSSSKGVLGSNKEKINDLVRRML